MNTNQPKPLEPNVEEINHPWYFDTFNDKEIIIKDSKGNIVHYFDYGSIPDETPNGVSEQIIIGEKLNSKFMVCASEAIAERDKRIENLAKQLTESKDTLRYIADRRDSQGVTRLHLGEIAFNKLTKLDALSKTQPTTEENKV